MCSTRTPPPRQGVWAATTPIALVRRMEWRHPLLYANPLGHRVLATLKMHKTRTKNERAVQCAVRAVCMFLSGGVSVGVGVGVVAGGVEGVDVTLYHAEWTNGCIAGGAGVGQARNTTGARPTCPRGAAV